MTKKNSVFKVITTFVTLTQTLHRKLYACNKVSYRLQRISKDTA